MLGVKVNRKRKNRFKILDAKAPLIHVTITLKENSVKTIFFIKIY